MVKPFFFDYHIKALLGPEKQYVYQHASSNANFNSPFLIITDDHKKAVIEQCSLPDKEILQMAFAKHCEAMKFRGDSGLQPHMILSLHIRIQRISPTFYQFE